jgi:hypothetical protein
MPWVPAPSQMPHRCFVTGQDAEDDGPYYSPSGRYYSEVGGDDRELVLYLSPQALREACEEPGSPFRLKTAEEEADAVERLAAAELRIEQLEADLADREAEVATLNDRPLIDTPALVASLEAHFAKKSGRKPGTQAA